MPGNYFQNWACDGVLSKYSSANADRLTEYLDRTGGLPRRAA